MLQKCAHFCLESCSHSGKTRAIVKLFGRGALMLTTGLFDLGAWIFWAIANLIALCAAVKIPGDASCHVGYRSCFYRSVPTGAPADKVELTFEETEKVFDPKAVYGDAPNPTIL